MGKSVLVANLLTIVAVVAGETATPEFVCRAAPENPEGTNVLPIVSRDGRIPTNLVLFVVIPVNEFRLFV